MAILVDPLWVEICGIRGITGLSGQTEVFQSMKSDATDSHSAEFRLFNVAVILMTPVYIWPRYEGNDRIGSKTHYLRVGWKRFINRVGTLLRRRAQKPLRPGSRAREATRRPHGGGFCVSWSKRDKCGRWKSFTAMIGPDEINGSEGSTAPPGARVLTKTSRYFPPRQT